MLNSFELKQFLDNKVEQYNTLSFIESDPVFVPHCFEKKQDIEIMGLFASIFAWGQRKTIISKSLELAKRMDGKPFDFVKNHSENDLKSLLGFKHRTFNDMDLLYSIDFLHRHYNQFDSLETAFFYEPDVSVESALIHFRNYFFDSEDAPMRTRKHVSSPAQKSACKRLNMFLRWMVRRDDKGVDFGIWQNVKPSALICPLDLHVDRTARMLGLLNRNKSDWFAAEELTGNLKTFDEEDPVKYDFALFGVSIEEKCEIDV
ncbi:MAG: hypothetical protein H6Q14_988 [Bacteroidetes bacterium]|nr:hypothetical protein [Bacteroidota bacterium]